MIPWGGGGGGWPPPALPFVNTIKEPDKMKITHCQTNHLTDPLGCAITQPVFTWQVEDAAGKA